MDVWCDPNCHIPSESSSSEWPQCEFCLLLSFQKPAQQNFPESHEAAPLAGANQPSSHPVPQEQEGAGGAEIHPGAGLGGKCPQLAGLSRALSQHVLPWPMGHCCPGRCSREEAPSQAREAHGCEVHAECVISSLQCPHCWIRGLENTT